MPMEVELDLLIPVMNSQEIHKNRKDRGGGGGGESSLMPMRSKNCLNLCVTCTRKVTLEMQTRMEITESESKKFKGSFQMKRSKKRP